MLFTQNHAQFFDNNGNPLNGGVVKFFEPGTSTPKDVYSDGDLATSIGSEVTLDSAGRAVIFLDGNYKVTLEDSGGSVIKTVDDINVPDTGGKTEITNPSFETAGASATDIPGWDRSAPSGVTVERVTTDNYHGAACLEITSDGSNAGYGETADFVSVSPGREYEVSFALESSSATVTNTVQVRWFDESQNLVSTSTVYNASSGNPTSFENKVFTATPPATARYAKIRAQLGATAGTTRFDDFDLNAQAILYARTEEINTAGQSPDDIDFSGLYYVGGGLSGSPTSNLGYVYHTQGPDADTAGQIWLDGSLDDDLRKMYFRIRVSGSWRDWKRIGDWKERVFVWESSTQSIPDSTGTDLEFDTEEYDIGGLWTSGSPTKFVCPRAGVVVLTAAVNWAANATGMRQITITKNGTGFVQYPNSKVPAGSSGVQQALSTPAIVVAANDEFQVNAFQDSGGALNVLDRHFSLRYIE